MADVNYTVLDSSETEQTFGSVDLGSGVQASKVTLVDHDGNLYGHADDEIIVPALVTEDIFHYAVHEGLSFSASGYDLSPTVNQGVYITFTTPATGYIHIIPEISTEDTAELRIYEGFTPTATATTADLVIYNKNRAALMNGTGASAVIAGNTSTVGAVQVQSGHAPTTTGTRIYKEFQAKNSGGRDATYELVLEKSTCYCFQAVALVGGKNLGMNLTWFDVPPAA